MPIKDSTMKRLFGMSRNECAMPDCNSPLIIGETVVGQICHIRARSKKGPRFDPTLSSTEKDDYPNLLLLCGTCHKLIDASPSEYNPVWLASIKTRHERKTMLPLDLSQSDTRNAMLLLQKHVSRKKKSVNLVGDGNSFGSANATAGTGGVAFAISGPNQGTISIRLPKPTPKGYPANSIGADANMSNYIDYLCDLYVKFMSPIEWDENRSWAKIGKHIKTRFHLKKQNRNHIPMERFRDLVNFIVNEKLARTPVGQKHLREGKRLCRTFDEFRRGEV